MRWLVVDLRGLVYSASEAACLNMCIMVSLRVTACHQQTAQVASRAMQEVSVDLTSGYWPEGMDRAVRLTLHWAADHKGLELDYAKVASQLKKRLSTINSKLRCGALKGKMLDSRLAEAAQWLEQFGPHREAGTVPWRTSRPQVPAACCWAAPPCIQMPAAW